MKIPLRKGLSNQPSVETIIASAIEQAESYEEAIPTDSVDISPSGSAFKIDLLLPIGAETGDGRKFSEGALSSRDLPLPLLWQYKTDSGHNQSVIIGRIDSLEITDNGIENVKGVFDTNPYAREAERLIRNKFLRGVSADLDKFSATEDESPEATLAQGKSKKIENKNLTIQKARLMGATVVSLPAFQEAKIEIDEPYSELEAPVPGEYVDGVLEEYSMESLVASAAPLAPPKDWFKRYPTNEPMPLTVDDNGRVYGYLALWNSNHIGYRHAQKPPRSASNYRYFRTGLLRTEDGSDISVGNITLSGGHANMQASADEAVKHYDDTNSSVIDVACGEDQFGIWVAGALRSTVSPEQVRALRASGISGDWRPINGRLELVGICCVNVPGFPTTRAVVASGGQVTALVAAGSQDLWEMKTSSSEMKNDIEELKKALFSIQSEEKVEKAREVFSGAKTSLDTRAERAFSIMAEELTSKRAKEEAELQSRVEQLQREFYA